MKTTSSLAVGIICILAGVAILIHNYLDVEGYFVHSLVLLGIGLMGLLLRISREPRRGIYFFSFITLTGLFLLLGATRAIPWSRGVIISGMIIIAGLAFFLRYALERREWQQLVKGGLVTGVGVFFLSEALEWIPPAIFPLVVDRYWPVALIIIGILKVFQAFPRSQSVSVSESITEN
ncbi:MAG: hypothetical protein D6681_00945 [Calditrichaeota bacterium]|nr:MAG: hypothetical protein D6681_00945 [Calditrichota bacterium]